MDQSLLLPARNSHKRGPLVSVLIFIVLCAQAAPALAAWSTVGNGIEYQKIALPAAGFSMPDVNNVFVARMLMSNTSATIETSMAQAKVNGVRETITAQSARLDEAISYANQTWGQRNDVVVAINGDFEGYTWGTAASGLVHSGWYAKRFANLTGGSGFAWTLNRYAFIGPCVGHTPSKQLITFQPSGNDMKFSGINIARDSNQLVVYTPQNGDNTGTDSSGVEVVVQLTRPMVIIPPSTSAKVVGNIREIRQNQGSTPIPFDSIVLSASGTAANTLLANSTLGGEVWIQQEISNYQDDCNTPQSGPDWTKTYAAIGGGNVVLKAGVPQDFTTGGLAIRAPRTAIAYDNAYVYFVVCDGRSTISKGMTGKELGTFCKELSSTMVDAINQDGGGSSVMVVNGVIKNVPSDGSERPVTNGIMMVNILPKSQATTFTTGQTVTADTTANVRLGPGTNYGSLGTVSPGTTGTIQSHTLNGVLAKGYNWWKVSFPTLTGWVAGSLLQACGAPPTSVTVTDEGAWTPSLTTLKANWTSSTATCGSISRYEYAIGTSPSSQNVRGWTSVGLSTSVTASSLALADGQTYYVQVRAVDTNGLTGAASASNGITVAPGVDPISAAWPLANGVGLAIRGKVVTAVASGAFWLEEQDRSAAIKVVSTAGVAKGNTVSVAGVLGTSGTQRALVGDVVANSGGSGPVPDPLGMACSSLGGASVNALTPGVTGGVSSYNVGMLVRCWGNVTYSNSSSPNDRFFYIDDGSRLSDGSGHAGVKVRCGSAAPPASGMVVVTGVVTTEQAGGKVVPVIASATFAMVP